MMSDPSGADHESAPDAAATPPAADPSEEAPDNQAARDIDAHSGSASAVLTRIADAAEGPEISVGAVVDGLEDRAFGMLILLFAIPALIPFLVGVHSAVSIPIALLAGQMILGRREPWLPERVRSQKIGVAAFRKMTTTAVPWIRRVEKLTRPRFTLFTDKGAERVLAFFIILFAGVIAIPGPGTNGVPGFAVALVSLGFIERDGLLASIGVLLGVVYCALFLTVGYAGIMFLIDQAMKLF